MIKKIVAFFLVIFFFLIYKFNFLKSRKKIFLNNGLIICPIRGLLKTKKFDSKGNYSEEFQRVRLIKYLIKKKGCKKNDIIIEHNIPIGHKGKNFLRADLVIKRNGKFLLIAEVKKNYNKSFMNSAIKHQLYPAMMILRSKYGVYFDGSENSLLLLRKNNGTIVKRKFPCQFDIFP